MFNKEMSACDISKVLSNYGDAFVVKDSKFNVFAEF